MRKSDELVMNAWQARTVVPSFNIAHLPMIEPVVKALRDTECFGFIAVSRPDWEKFGAQGIEEVFKEYQRFKDERYTRLHLDHIPVIDEDGLEVDYWSFIDQALKLGYQSVMVDGSRLSLEDNIKATKEIVDMAHSSEIAVEGELGAVFGHEEGPVPPYDELFSSGKGFTDPDEAKRFVEETRVDWLSVAVGNIHGALSGAAKDEEKIAARINVEHLQKIKQRVSIPLVLHGGSGIRKNYILGSIRNGIAKVNVGTVIRQVYEKLQQESITAAQESLYEKTARIIGEEMEIEGSTRIIDP